MKLIEVYKPDSVKSWEFDETRKEDYIYCIEFGMNKAKVQELATFDRMIEDIKLLMDK